MEFPGAARASWVLSPFVTSLRGLRGVIPPSRAARLAWRFGRVERFVPCPHSVVELARIARAIAQRRNAEGDVVECGCFKGGSTARLSLVCRELGRKLVVFDSFEGLPEPEAWDICHEIARPRRFVRGEYHGTLEEVRANVSRYGDIEVCEFVPGWFASTMADSTPEQVVVAFVDADLVASTREALDRLWPRLVAGGIIFVHDTTDPKLASFLEGWRTDVRPAHSGGLRTSLAWFEK